VFVLFVCEHILTLLNYRASCYNFGMVGTLLTSVHSDCFALLRLTKQNLLNLEWFFSLKFDYNFKFLIFNQTMPFHIVCPFTSHWTLALEVNDIWIHRWGSKIFSQLSFLENIMPLRALKRVVLGIIFIPWG
jgi:hypothetical protein